jgi:hypothetical protein
VTAQRDEITRLKKLVDPTKDQCEAWVYLKELERIVQSSRACAGDGACYDESLTLGTYLECWHPDCYQKAYSRWVVAFNDADYAQKIATIELAEATKLRDKLVADAAEAVKERLNWILKELKASNCCGPDTKCP